MDYQVIWSKTAIADLRDLVRYIAHDHSETARKFGDQIITKVEGLHRFPKIGRMVPEYRIDCLRELSMSP